MRKLIQLSGLMLAVMVALGSSSGGDDDDDDDIIVDIDADTTPQPDAAPGNPDAAPPFPSAANLGQPCAGAGGVACAGGEDCVTITGIGSQTEGFCTIPCPTAGDTASCSNGYTGGGMPACALDNGMGGFSCAVLCTVGTPGQCAVGTVCTAGGGGALCTGDE